MRTLPLALLLGLAACGDNGATPDAAPHVDSRVIDAPAIDAPAIDAPAIDAAPLDTAITLAGGANGLLWDAASSTLLFTDNGSDTLRKYTDAGGLADVATLPAETAGISLGTLVRRADGTTLIANFGFGTQGTLFEVSAGATPTSTALTGFDGTRRRISIAQDNGGQLYSSYFTKTGTTFAGGVATVAIAGTVGTEVEIAGASTSAGFGKIVGLVATPTAIYASDQTAKTIFQIAVPGFAVTTLASGLPSADLLLLMPNGDLLTGGGPTVSRITPAGVVSAVPTHATFENVEGLAYDPAGHRLFLIDHSATAGVPDTLHIESLAQ